MNPHQTAAFAPMVCQETPWSASVTNTTDLPRHDESGYMVAVE